MSFGLIKVIGFRPEFFWRRRMEQEGHLSADAFRFSWRCLTSVGLIGSFHYAALLWFEYSSRTEEEEEEEEEEEGGLNDQLVTTDWAPAIATSLPVAAFFQLAIMTPR